MYIIKACTYKLLEVLNLNLHDKHIIIIYDGDCGICSFLANFLSHRIPKDIELTYNISDYLTDTYGKQLRQISTISIILIDNGYIYIKMSAICKILSKMSLIYKIISFIFCRKLLIPFFNRLYDFIARHRHQLSKFFGKPECKIKP